MTTPRRTTRHASMIGRTLALLLLISGATVEHSDAQRGRIRIPRPGTIRTLPTTINFAGRSVQFATLGLDLVPQSVNQLDNLGMMLHVEDNALVVSSNFTDAAQTGIYGARTEENVALEDLVTTFARDESTPAGQYWVENASAIQTATADKVKFIVDPGVFEHPTFSSIDLNDAKQVYVLDQYSNLRRVRRLLDPEGNSGQAYAEFLDNVWAEATDRSAAAYFETMRRTPFRRDDFRVLSLVTNTTTNKKIAENLADLHVPFDFSSTETLRARLREHKGKQLFVIGHVEGDAFRTYSAAGQEIFSVPVQQLIGMARECCDITLIPLGCDVAELVGRGTANSFKSGYAVDRLGFAAANATNQSEFWQAFAGPDMRLVLHSSMVPGTDQRTISIFEVLEGDGRILTGRLTGRATTLARDDQGQDEPGSAFWSIVIIGGFVLAVLLVFGKASETK